MKKNKLSEVVFKNLIGKKIFNVGDNWIQLDNGLKIYLDNLEIELLNDGWDDDVHRCLVHDSMTERVCQSSLPEAKTRGTSTTFRP